MEDVAARQPELGLQLDRRAGLEARPRRPAPRHRQSSIGSASTRVERAQRAPRSPAALAPAWSRREQPRGHVQREAGQRLRAGARAGRRRGCSGRSASGSRPRTAAGAGIRPAGGLPRSAAASCGCSLVDVERPGERLARVDRGVAQPRQPRQQHVELELRALRRRLGRRLAQQRGRAPPARRSRARRARARAAARPSGPRRARRRCRSPVTSTPQRSSAPARAAAPASAAVSAPMPPTGTSQSPVPLPITW